VEKEKGNRAAGAAAAWGAVARAARPRRAGAHHLSSPVRAPSRAAVAANGQPVACDGQMAGRGDWGEAEAARATARDAGCERQQRRRTSEDPGRARQAVGRGCWAASGIYYVQ
jgi:hypothetical protein